MYPGIPADSASVVMSDAIFRAFVEKIHDLIGNDEYSEAFDLLRVLSAFFGGIPGRFSHVSN